MTIRSFIVSRGARAALYARYSSSQQKQTSIEDQLRCARTLAQNEGWIVVAQYQDEEVRGTVPLAMREGGASLLAAAKAGEFDILIMEGLDRFSRDSVESGRWTKRLEHYRICVIGTADGYDSRGEGRTVMRLARGMQNEVALEDLAKKTHRGLEGSFVRGDHVGGTCYGYRSVPSANGIGKSLVIDEAQSSIVRRIFEMFADGHSHRQIVYQLNAEGVPSPRDGTWTVSALYGDTKRAAGLLNNELYVGKVIWNRRQWLKDPETGARRPFMRPREEWQCREDESLRIISPELWERVRNRERSGAPAGTRKGRGAAPKTLLSGLLTCESCGGPIVAIDRYRYGCNVHADRGPTVCSNPAKVKRQLLEQRLIEEIRAELLLPDAISEMKSMAKQIALATQKESRGGVAGKAKRLAVLSAEIKRLVEAIATIGVSSALAERLSAAEAEHAQISAELSRAKRGEPPPDQLVEALVARYQRLVSDLDEVIGDVHHRERARTVLAGLLGPVVVGVDADGQPWAEIEKPAVRLWDAVGGSTGLVARARFELATFGL
jgi:site-specific DNA recombinase